MNIRSLHVDSDGTVWAGTDEGLARSSGKGFESAPSPATTLSRVLSITRAKDGALWLGGDGWLSRYDGDALRNYTKPTLPVLLNLLVSVFSP